MALRLVTDTNGQMVAGGTTTNPVYGIGSRGYGADGEQVRGREAHIQMREQNSGFAPSEDYRVAKFLGGLWRDLDRNGCPYVVEGGAVVGVAGVVTAGTGGQAAIFSHQVMPANAGVKQQLTYTALDTGVALDIDTLFVDAGTDDQDIAAANAAVVAAIGDSYHYALGNKPLAYNPTPELSSAWEDVYTNQKFSHQTTMKTQWNCMYPVSNGFMYGGLTFGTGSGIATDGIVTVDAISGGGDVAADSANAVVTRNSLGFKSVSIDFTSTKIIEGIQAGDNVMPNPWLPGTLISVLDFARVVVGCPASDAAAAVTAVGFTATSFVDCVAYGMLHKVGRCLKRQSRALVASGQTTVTGQDIYGSTYKYMITPPGLGLSGGSSEGIEADQEAGGSSEGIEADQEAARQFAKNVGEDAGSGTMGLDVVFINYNIK